MVEDGFILRLGEINQQLLVRIFAKDQVETATKRSVQLPPNIEKQRCKHEMHAEIESLKLVPWAGKASALIMVIGLKQAKMLGLKY